MFNVVFTDEGRALIAEIASDIDYSLLISDVKFSDHDYTGQEATVTEATFTGDFASGTNTISVVDSTTMRIESSFDNRYINVQKDLYTIGIFAKCVKVNGMIYTEIDSGLLAVCTVSTPRIIPPYADAPFSVFSYNINLAVGSADNVTVVETQAGVQYKELITPLTINGNTESTVEDALGGLNDYSDALKDNLAANENVYGAKNLWNIEKWLNDIGQAFTKSGDVYTTTISDARTNTNKCVFSDTDIEVTLSAELTASGSMQFYVELFNSSDQNVGSISLSNPTFTGLGCKLRFNFNNTGTVTLTAPMLRDARVIDPTFAPFAKTNLQLTNDKAERADIATINVTGSTNTTGSTIAKDTLFYLNGSLCKANENILNGASFTLNTNYKIDTVNDELLKIRVIEYNGSAADDKTFFTDVINHVISLYGGSGLTFQFIVGGLKQATYYYKGIGYGYFGGGTQNYISLQCSSYASVFLIEVGGGTIQIRQIDGTLI